MKYTQEQPVQPKDDGYCEDEYSDYIGDIRPREQVKSQQKQESK